MKAHLLISIFLGGIGFAGDFVDLGKTDRVPDWAVGPLLVLPAERVTDGHLVAKKAETKRIGTIQATYIELDDQRLKIDSIHLSEVPNDGYSCQIITSPHRGVFYDIHISQTLFDRTFYYIYIQKMDEDSKKRLEKKQWVVWDIKSRK